VSLENISLHYILLPIADTINEAKIFKRFIDDIVWLSYTTETTNQIENNLNSVFQRNDLEILEHCKFGLGTILAKR